MNTIINNKNLNNDLFVILFQIKLSNKLNKKK